MQHQHSSSTSSVTMLSFKSLFHPGRKKIDSSTLLCRLEEPRVSSSTTSTTTTTTTPWPQIQLILQLHVTLCCCHRFVYFPLDSFWSPLGQSHFPQSRQFNYKVIHSNSICTMEEKSISAQLIAMHDCFKSSSSIQLHPTLLDSFHSSMASITPSNSASSIYENTPPNDTIATQLPVAEVVYTTCTATSYGVVYEFVGNNVLLISGLCTSITNQEIYQLMDRHVRPIRKLPFPTKLRLIRDPIHSESFLLLAFESEADAVQFGLQCTSAVDFLAACRVLSVNSITISVPASYILEPLFPIEQYTKQTLWALDDCEISFLNVSSALSLNHSYSSMRDIDCQLSHFKL